MKLPTSTETKDYKIFEFILSQLGPYMMSGEVDAILDFLYELENTKYSVSFTAHQAESQMRLILGSDRYTEIVLEWSERNQKYLKQFNNKYFQHTTTKKLKKTLDELDDPTEFKDFYI